MEKLKQISKWVYILIAFIALITFSIITNDSSESNLENNKNESREKESTKEENNENSKKEYTLDDFPKIKEKTDNIISKLKESEWFTSINFKYLVGEEEYANKTSDWIVVYYNLRYGNGITEADIGFGFKNDELNEIKYTSDSNETSSQKYNRKMELLKLAGISESSFSNKDANNKWETLKHIVSGENCDTYALTDDCNQVSCYSNIFSIYIKWIDYCYK